MFSHISILQSITSVFAIISLWFIVREIVRFKQLQSYRKGLFRFHDGIKLRHVDPIEVLSSLHNHPDFAANVHVRQAMNGNAESLAIVANAVQRAFNVPLFTSPKLPGLSKLECLELLSAFWRWVDLQKKSTRPLPTVAQSMESTSTGSTEPITSAT